MRALLDRIAADGGAACIAADDQACADAVEQFVAGLSRVPDYPAAELTQPSFAMVSALADKVIANIERRLESSDGDERQNARLAESVYDVRAAIEEIYRWRRHYRQPS